MDLKQTLLGYLLLACFVSAGCTAYDWHESGFLDRKTESLFQSMALPYRVGQDPVVELSYRLYIPPGAYSSEAESSPWPMLVWLHGYGEAGDDNREHLRWMNLLMQEPRFPGFILAYQCPPERPTWSTGEKEYQPMTLAKAIVDNLLETSPIDRKRIYISGVSSGGSGCWEMILRYPDLFAAAVPLASAGTDYERLSCIASVPIWSFHATEDPEASIKHVWETVHRLQATGGKVWLTETAGITHDSWTSAFNDYHFVDWLLAQRQGEQIVPIPWWAGLKSFQSRYLKWDYLWPPLVLMSVVVGLAWAVRRHVRLQQVEKRSPAENELH